MSKYNGKDGKIYISESDGTPAVLAQSTGYNFENKNELQDATSLGDQAKSRATGLNDSSLSITVFYDATGDTTGQGILTPGTEFDAILYPEGLTDGRMAISGSFIVESASLPVEVGGIIILEVTAQGNGDITYGTYSAA